MDRFYAKYLDDVMPGMGGSPEMSGMPPVTLAWTLYEQYGDVATLTRHYDNLAAYVRSLRIGRPTASGPRATGSRLVSASPRRGIERRARPPGCRRVRQLHERGVTRQHGVVLPASSGDVLGGKGAGARRGRCIFLGAGGTRQGCLQLEHFLDETTGVYGSGRQTTSVLPLAFDMVPAADREVVGRTSYER